jgi:hypothetical protein
LNNKFGLKAVLNRRIKENKEICYRISIRKESINKLRELIKEYMIKEMLYKIGL